MVFENSRNPTEAETELYERHIMNKHEAYTALLIDSEDPSKTVVSFDLQQILPFPKLSTTKQTFYKSRMVCYNLCLYVKSTKRGYRVSWSQVEGGRGSNEIATCLKYFVENHLADSRHIVFYSDGCAGQNKNQAVVACLATMAHNSPAGLVIEIKYFKTGQSHMEVDSVHACIETRAEGTEIGTPNDWISVFQSAKLQGEQYTVDELRHHQFVDWKQVARSAFKPNALEGIFGMHWIRAKNVGGRVELSWGEGCLGPLRSVEWRKVGGQTNWLDLPPAYTARLPLPKKRYEDSLSIVRLLRNRGNAELYFRDVEQLVQADD